MENETDYDQVEPLTERVAKSYPDKKVNNHSLDKGFFSKGNYNIMINADIGHVVLPKKGRKNAKEKQRESDPKFIELRHAHSAVESNINMLEHHGLNRCPDKGLPKYKCYVCISVLAYNLHILGNHLLAKEKKKNDSVINKQPE